MFLFEAFKNKIHLLKSIEIPLEKYAFFFAFYRIKNFDKILSKVLNNLWL